MLVEQTVDTGRQFLITADCHAPTFQVTLHFARPAMVMIPSIGLICRCLPAYNKEMRYPNVMFFIYDDIVMWSGGIVPPENMNAAGFYLLLLALFILTSILNANFLAETIIS